MRLSTEADRDDNRAIGVLHAALVAGARSTSRFRALRLTDEQTAGGRA
jgi:hypothetical protein